MKLVRIFIFFMTFFLLVVPAWLAAAPPPEGVDEVIEQMGELEENFEAENWGEAREAVEKMVNEVSEIVKKTHLEDPVMMDALTSLVKYVNEKNQKQVEVQYIRFQKLYFQYISQFDYEIHPILIMIQQYVVNESSEAYEKKDYEDVISEMREAGNLIDHARPLLVEKGISEQEVTAFKTKVIELIMVGKKREYAKMGELLEVVKKDYGSFMTRYKQ